MMETSRVRWENSFHEAVVEWLNTTFCVPREAATWGSTSSKAHLCLWSQQFPWHSSLHNLVLQCLCFAYSPVPFIPKTIWIRLTCTATPCYLLYFEFSTGISKTKLAWIFRTVQDRIPMLLVSPEVVHSRSKVCPMTFSERIMPHKKLLCTYLSSFKNVAAILE